MFFRSSSGARRFAVLLFVDKLKLELRLRLDAVQPACPVRTENPDALVIVLWIGINGRGSLQASAAYVPCRARLII